MAPSTEREETADPLRGLLVADFSVTLPGPYCSQLLRRLGARVIHLEPPGGDPVRVMLEVFDRLAEGKESVRVDLTREDDRAAALRVTDVADVVIEGWRPGIADRLGVGPSVVMARNPKAVYCSISGYGQIGELAARAGHDVNYVAEAGALPLVHTAGLPVADLSGAMFAALRILAAVRHADCSGVGAHVDVSIAGSLRDWVEAIGADRTQSPLPPVYSLPHYGSFATSDGAALTLGVVFEQPLWRALAAGLGRPEWRELDAPTRATRSAELRSEIGQIVATATAAEWDRRLAGVDTCWALAREPGDHIRAGGQLPRRAGHTPELDEHGASVREEFIGQLAGSTG